jgi:hypothetical protein
LYYFFAFTLVSIDDGFFCLGFCLLFLALVADKLPTNYVFLSVAGGGRNPVTNRLLRHFNFISFTEMSDQSVNRIFSTILGAFFR